MMGSFFLPHCATPGSFASRNQQTHDDSMAVLDYDSRTLRRLGFLRQAKSKRKHSSSDSTLPTNPRRTNRRK